MIFSLLFIILCISITGLSASGFVNHIAILSLQVIGSLLVFLYMDSLYDVDYLKRELAIRDHANWIERCDLRRKITSLEKEK